jgi:O-antigen ligase
MGGWFSLGSLTGMAIALAFAAFANRDLRRGALWYAVLGGIPWFQVGALAGNEMVTGIPLAEVLGTVLFIVWLLRRDKQSGRRMLPWERWVLLLIAGSFLSLVSGYAWLDPRVPQQNVKIAVSIGQILLFAWPLGIYYVVSDVVDGRDWLDRFSRIVLALAVPQALMLLVPSTKQYLFWSTYFGLIAAPLALTRATYERETWKKVALGLFILPPLIEGFLVGKAFLYGYIAISSGIILWMRAQAAFRLAVPAAGLIVMLLYGVVGDRMLPGFVREMIHEEESSQSWGGQNGRGQLLADAIDVWSTHPTLGVGPANSYPYMIGRGFIGTPHNQYADILVECGLLGLFFFLAFVASVLQFGWFALKRPRDPDSQMFMIGWFASFAAMAVVSITGDYLLHSIRNGGIEMFSGFYIHWVFLGAAVGFVRHEAAARAYTPYARTAARRMVPAPARAAAPRTPAPKPSTAPVRERPRVWSVPPAPPRKIVGGSR